MWSQFCVGGLFNATVHIPSQREMKAWLLIFTANQTDTYTEFRFLDGAPLEMHFQVLI